MDSTILFQLLKQANNEGAKGRRFVGVTERATNATDNPLAGYAVGFDNGPQTASETPWPEDML